MTVDDVEARLIEIAENLHRNELTELERKEQISEWIRLTECQNVISAQHEPKLVGRPKSGINAAVEKLNIDRNEGQRSSKIAAMTPTAKEAARETGLDDNQAALLEAARQVPDRQAATIHAIKDAGSVSAYKAAQKALKLAPEPMGDFEAKEKWIFSIMALWNRAARNVRIEAPIEGQR